MSWLIHRHGFRVDTMNAEGYQPLSNEAGVVGEYGDEAGWYKLG
jgi:hypothetical protein